MHTGMVFCVDGGGTRTRGRLISAQGNEIARAETGPCNISTNPVLAANNVSAAWQECAGLVDLDAASPASTIMSIGAAGATVVLSRDIFLKACPAFGQIILMTDGHAAMVGAGNGFPCGLIIAGTGAVGHRLYEDGRSIRRDGWGWVAGDRGSGAWIGREALRHAIEVYDGLRPLDGLAEETLRQLEAEGGVQRGLTGIQPHQIGAFAPFAFAAAERGEAVASRIIEQAIEHLGRLAQVLDLEAETPLYFAGGLAPLFREGLSKYLGRNLLAPQADAAYGCYLVANGRAPVENVALTSFKLPGAHNAKHGSGSLL